MFLWKIVKIVGCGFLYIIIPRTSVQHAYTDTDFAIPTSKIPRVWKCILRFKILRLTILSEIRLSVNNVDKFVLLYTKKWLKICPYFYHFVAGNSWIQLAVLIARSAISPARGRYLNYSPVPNKRRNIFYFLIQPLSYWEIDQSSKFKFSFPLLSKLQNF